MSGRPTPSPEPEPDFKPDIKRNCNGIYEVFYVVICEHCIDIEHCVDIVSYHIKFFSALPILHPWPEWSFEPEDEKNAIGKPNIPPQATFKSCPALPSSNDSS